jgi:hypothetical protein
LAIGKAQVSTKRSDNQLTATRKKVKARIREKYKEKLIRFAHNWNSGMLE